MAGPKSKKKKGGIKKRNTVKNYFPTVSNFQGFPRNKCVFNTCIKDYVYVPQKYVEEARAGPISTFCEHCLLAPCLAESHYAMIKEKASGFILADGATPLIATQKCETFMKGRMRRYFGPTYTRERGLPQCAYEAIGDLVPHYVSIHAIHLSSAEEDSSSSEEEESQEEEGSEDEGCNEEEEGGEEGGNVQIIASKGTGGCYYDSDSDCHSLSFLELPKEKRKTAVNADLKVAAKEEETDSEEEYEFQW